MKLRVLSGLPGSGKTTYAREQVREHGSIGRINRDDLRAMLFDSVWSGPREGVVIDCEKAIAKVLLNHKLVALVDDTNLSAKTLSLWSGVAKSLDAQLEIKTLDTSLAECIKRDAARPKPVGEAVINRVALFAGMIDFGPKPIVLVDVDGTTANGDHRQHFIEGPRKDWKSYFSLCHMDEPVRKIIDEVNSYRDHTIIVCSGRPDTYQHETLKWLREKAELKFDYIFMRAGNDKREDSIIKLEILDHLPADQIEIVYDDRLGRPNPCGTLTEFG
jgi:predicted kinase